MGPGSLLALEEKKRSALAQPQQAPQQPAPQALAPVNVMDQMDERKGTFMNRLGLMGHMLSGGKASEYGDADLLAQQKSYQTQQALQDKMGLLEPYIAGLNSDDPQAQAQSMLALSQAGVTEDMMGMLAPNIAQQFNTPTYTKGTYEKIDGRWNLVQQADDGSVKYTQMAEDFTPSSRMMSGDALQRGLQEYQTASFGASQNVEGIDQVLGAMDELGPDGWGETGFVGQAGQRWREFTGTENAVDMARKQYEGIKTTRAIQNLPPGVASDKDIELVLKPFPSSFTSYEQLQDYLKKLKRGEQKIQEYNNFSARYLSNSGMRDGMIDAWDKHWEEMNAEGGRFYQEPKRKPQATPTNQLPETIRRPDAGGPGGGVSGEFDSSLLDKYRD